ncbi:MAG: DUF3786 domain-containing protein [Candidatus Omnitrophota bacterium]|nr:MAG: DUF3786 domain-containing protein [Candidatus Omnitrophota bacterium]
MGYEAALSKGWSDVESLSQEKTHQVQFLNDTYTLNVEDKSILSDACNIAAKPYLSILLLHYLAQSLKGLSSVKGEWITFQQLSGGQAYYPVFSKRVVEPLIAKYGSNPQALLDALKPYRAEPSGMADASVILNVLEGVPILIQLWGGDEEFKPNANMLFDKSIMDIFPTEDVVILAEIIVRTI